LTVHAFVSNLAGNGGYVLAEASDPKVIVTFVSKYNFWNDVNVVPVVDVGEVVPMRRPLLGRGALQKADRSAVRPKQHGSSHLNERGRREAAFLRRQYRNA
jgi:hypothetical protein